MLNSNLSAKHLHGHTSNSHIDRTRHLIQASRLSRLSPLRTEDPSKDPYTPDKKTLDRQFSVTKSKSNIHDKVDSILKHNSHLLAENNKLVEVIRDKENQLTILEARLCSIEKDLNAANGCLRVFQADRNKNHMEFRNEKATMQSEMQQILMHNEMLQSRMTSLDSQHKIEIISLKEALMQDTQTKISCLKRSQCNSTQHYQLQIKRLKDTIDSNTREYESRFHSSSVTQKQLEEEVRQLLQQIKHTSAKTQLESQQQRLNYDNLLVDERREMAQRFDKAMGESDIQLKKLRKELGEKEFENDRLLFRLENQGENNRHEYEDVKRDKAAAELEMQEMESKNKQMLEAQKMRLNTLAEAEIGNLRDCQENHLRTLEEEKARLLDINQLKTQEIVTLQSQLLSSKETNHIQISSLQHLIETLKGKLLQLSTSNQQESEFLKVKVAQLHHSDVSSLVSSYENQILALCEKTLKHQEAHRATKDKLHKQLEQKTELRKHYEIQISKIYNKNIELKLKLQSKDVEMKENSEIVLSKHNIVSEGLLREAETTRKDVGKREGDIRRLQELVGAKDTEIHSLNDKILILKENIQEEVRRKDEEIEGLKEEVREVEGNSRKEKEFYEREVRRRDEEIRSQKKELEEQMKNLQSVTYEQLMKQLEACQREKMSLESLLTKETKEKETILRSMHTHREMTEVFRLQSSSALQNQKYNTSSKYSLEESKRSQVFQQQVSSKNKEIEELKRRLLEKNEDLRDMEMRHHELEERLRGLMEMLRSRTELESRVMALGMDNNLLKSKAELFRDQ